MNKTVITWIVVIVLVILGVIIVKSSNKDESNLNTNNPESVTTPGNNTQTPAPGVDTSVNGNISTPTTPSLGSQGTATVKSFTVTGSNFSFSPATLTVNKGDTVRITFVNQNGMHDWMLDEFNAKTKVIQGGQSETIEFVADKTGSFEYYCSVGTHRQMGMKGTLTVK